MRARLILFGCLLLLVTGCGGGGSGSGGASSGGSGGGSGSGGSSSTITGLSVTCSPQSITTIQTSACAATVTGTGSFSTSVTWSATGGTITAGGLFTPSTTGNSVILATSTQDTSKTGSATVIVTSPGPTVTSVGVACAPATISLTQTSSCNAFVGGTGGFNSSVRWSASSGTISSVGVFTPSSVGSITITATSVQNPAISGSSPIQVVAAPSISGLSPSSVLAGAGDTPVTVNGTSFRSPTVALDGTTLASANSSSTSVQATLPATPLAVGQLHLISITNSDGTTSPTSGPWQQIQAGMTARRSYHAQVVLQNGMVLLIGGGSVSGLIAYSDPSAELYNPATRTFTKTGSMSTGRIYPAVTILKNGKVLVAGGSGSAPNGSTAAGGLASAELYDPSTGTFAPTGSMTTSRVFHTATLLLDGTVLIAGGLDTTGAYLGSAEIYDPTAGTFSAVGSMATPRGLHAAVLLASSKVLILAGQSSTNPVQDTSTAEIYDPSLGQFVATGNLITPRESPTANLLSDGTVLIEGGYQNPNGVLQECELYHPSTGQFSTTGAMSTPRALHSSALQSDGTVLVIGGIDGSSILSSTEVYDPKTSAFQISWSMTTARDAFPASQLQDGSIFVSGGYNTTIGQLYTAEIIPPPSSQTGIANAIFTVNNPVPAISSVSPISVAAGSAAVLTGTGIVPPSEILVSGIAVPSYADPTMPNQVWFYPGTVGSYTVSINNPGPGGGVSNTVTVQVHVGISIDPAHALWAPGSTNSFTATITGTSNTAVTWNVQEGAAGGTIDTSGNYTAPSTPGIYHVSATSVADPNQSATATVVIHPDAGSVILGPALTVERGGHTATLLNSGKVLLAGGDSTGVAAEIYDPGTNSFAPTGNMVVPRYFHQAVLLSNGKVLLVCGEYGSQYPFTASPGADLYDPASGTFSSASAMITPGRDSCTATALQNGKVLIAGGYNTTTQLPMADAELYDPVANQFTSVGNMTVARNGQTATLLNNGKVLLAGGERTAAAPGYTASAELFDPATDTFAPTGDATVPIAGQHAILLPSGKVLLMGQYVSSCEQPSDLYDPSTGLFSQLSLPAYDEALGLAAISLPNGLGFFSGGAPLNCTGFGFVMAHTQFFDPGTNLFFGGPSLNKPRSMHTMTLLPNGKVLVAGGTAFNPDVTELYTPGATDPIPASLP